MCNSQSRCLIPFQIGQTRGFLYRVIPRTRRVFLRPQVSPHSNTARTITSLIPLKYFRSIRPLDKHRNVVLDTSISAPITRILNGRRNPGGILFVSSKRDDHVHDLQLPLLDDDLLHQGGGIPQRGAFDENKR
jgi:hypothetical protein